MNKIIICSVPKSGTYFLGQILTRLGLRDSKIHVNLHSYTDYNGVDLDTARHKASELRVHEPLSSSLQRISPSEFVVGHLPVTTAPMLREFGVIFTYRNVRDILVSFCRWVAQTGRWPDDGNWRELPDGPEKLLGFLQHHGRQLRGLIDCPAGWKSQPGATQVAFEELMGDYGADAAADAMQRIARAVGSCEHSDADLLQILEDAKGTETITRSGARSSRELFWNEAVEREFVCRRFALINQRLGFDEPSEAGWGGRWRKLRDTARKIRLPRRAA